MQTNTTAARLLLIFIITGLLTLPLLAEKKIENPASNPKESRSDIWQEVTFVSPEDSRLTEKQVTQAMNQLRKTNPEKAEQLEQLKNTDLEAFVKAIREHVLAEKADASKDKKQPRAKWKEKLRQRHERFLAWYKEHYPEAYDDLSELKNTNPDLFVQKVIDLLKIYDPIQKTEKSNPKLAKAMKKNLELQQERDAVLLQIQISSGSEQAKLIEELKTIISKRFDTIVLEKQLLQESMKKRLEALARKIETRNAALDNLIKTKDQSVETRLKELVERTEKVNWN